MPSICPDPTLDLHWSDYRGAIHEIFTENAKIHPNRTCVVETGDAKNKLREWTYKQLDEMSNILAHHLVNHGIQRGEVVMIFAHRSVELVIAIMGTLKAGATFSVLDPQYPPDRQIIYLDVSRPKALVVLGKAREDAGDLSPKVRSWITENLDLRTEVPSLEVVDSDHLSGGSLNGREVLEEESSLRVDLPGVLVGPDSTPTLSFTSGSEGVPKGVKGRHFSLAYYYPWMSEQFHLSDKDRFTMLSGIAHDPIQRDIFTPLFLGAQLLVPSKEDIQHEKLAEWMQKYGATVTHLTPAMGQILVGGASAQFPALHHAFFVGDILIKRDCRRLQDLAPNCNIVNMYGTTETSRAVSYYEIPSRSQDPEYLDRLGNKIPAGKGMYDVQLLVVDREKSDRLCEAGEVGEIYVRAGGLAEGYLGLDDATASKFITNWFVDPQKWIEQDKKRVATQGKHEPWRKLYKGPRDRLYRSGDLGYYMEDGNVAVTGRADDQVKIRGFRIELGEIDTHLSQHPLVRENVTLVRRDKDEEPTLVSYIVPEMKRWQQWLEERGVTETANDDSMVGMLKRFRALRDDVKEYLKTKVPAYSVPSVIVPLSRMPLNPNGKVDKPALPFPESSDLAASAARRFSNSAALTETEKAVASIWASVIPHVSAGLIGPQESFFDLGGHSIIAQQMLLKVRKSLGVDIPMSLVFRNPSLKGFSREVERAKDPIGLRLDSSAEADGEMNQDEDHAADTAKLVEQLPSSFKPASFNGASPQTVFLTGATGFLGSFIIAELLQRKNPAVRVIAHVRAKDEKSALQRVVTNCKANGVWEDAWSSRLQCVAGDLTKPNLGLKSEVWERLAEEVDVVIHNGARVHWVLPYSSLKASNTLSTLAALKLCATGRPKQFAFVSSTSVLDTEHYVSLSQRSISSGGSGVGEDDDLEGSRRGLGTGYGQSKWASEYLVRRAGERGLNGTIIRPGYVTGSSRSGTTITDDFLVRFLKGCIQLSSRPSITNTINMVPVDHVARVVVASAFFPPSTPLGVAHVNAHPRLTFNQYLGVLETYGYEVPEVEYSEWTAKMEEYCATASEQGREEHALLPLYHMVTTSLPYSTIAPELSSANAAKALRADAEWSGSDAFAGPVGVSERLVGMYIAYLVDLGFLPKPPTGNKARRLPEVKGISEEQRAALKAIGGRGAGTGRET